MVSRDDTFKDKKLEHIEDLQRMSRILARRAEDAKASQERPASPMPLPCEEHGS